MSPVCGHAKFCFGFSIFCFRGVPYFLCVRHGCLNGFCSFQLIPLNTLVYHCCRIPTLLYCHPVILHTHVTSSVTLSYYFVHDKHQLHHRMHTSTTGMAPRLHFSPLLILELCLCILRFQIDTARRTNRRT